MFLCNVKIYTLNVKTLKLMISPLRHEGYLEVVLICLKIKDFTTKAQRALSGFVFCI